MEKKIILFAVNTEFVLSIALLYYENHREKEGFYPVWFILKGNSNRFKDLNLNQLPGDKFEFLNNLNTRELKPDLSFLKVLKNYKVKEFVHQNSLNISNVILENKIKRTNPNVVKTYISDSIALSVETRKRTIKVANTYLLFRKFVNGLFYLPNRLLMPKQYIESVDNYINIEKIDNVPATFFSFKELLANTSNSIYLPLIFNFNWKKDYDVIFFTQPIMNHASFPENVKMAYQNVLDILSKNAEISKTYTLIKVHPGENNLDYKKFENTFCNIFENNNIPAEILFSMFSNKKIFSCFSSISVLDFLQNNHHFWLYPMINHHPKFTIDTSGIKLIKNEQTLIQNLN